MHVSASWSRYMFEAQELSVVIIGWCGQFGHCRGHAFETVLLIQSMCCLHLPKLSKRIINGCENLNIAPQMISNHKLKDDSLCYLQGVTFKITATNWKNCWPYAAWFTFTCRKEILDVIRVILFIIICRKEAED